MKSLLDELEKELEKRTRDKVRKEYGYWDEDDVKNELEAKRQELVWKLADLVLPE